MKVLKQLSTALLLTLSMSSAFARNSNVISINAFNFINMKMTDRPSAQEFCVLRLEKSSYKFNLVDGGCETRTRDNLTLYSKKEGKFVQVVSENEFSDVVESTVVSEYKTQCNMQEHGVAYSVTNKEENNCSLAESIGRRLGDDGVMQ